VAHDEHHDDHAHDDHGHGDGHAHHGLGHVVPFKILAGVGAALLVLTVITVLAARVHFGQFNLVIALLIATFKASLVALFFMHLKWDKPFHALVVVSGIFAAMLFVAIAFMDGNQYQRDICASRGADCKIWRDAIHEYEAGTSPGRVTTPSPTPPPAPAPGTPPPAPAGVTPATP
jgi:cytochrome c oxidase subunit 4